MGKYVDGLMLRVPKRNLEAYRRVAKVVEKARPEHGVLALPEGVADQVRRGKLTSFPQSMNLKDDERPPSPQLCISRAPSGIASERR